MEGDDLFEAGWALVVKNLKARRGTLVVEVSVEGGVSTNYFLRAVRFECLCDDGITVIVLEDHEVFSATTGSDRETTSLVRGYLAGDFDGLQECHFGSNAGFRGWNRLCCHFWHMFVYGRGGGDLGGPNVFVLLSKMPLDDCEHLGKMFADDMRVEAWTSGLISGINGRGTYQYEGAESGVIEITDKIRLGIHFIGTVIIQCGESQSVSDGGFRSKSEVDIV